MRLELLPQPDVSGLHAVLLAMNADPAVASILILACEADGLGPDELNPLLQGCRKPLFGGVFPQIVHGREKLEQGMIVAGLSCPVRVHALEGLGSEFTDFDEHILALFGEEDLRGKTMFVLLDGLSRGIARLVESLFNTLGLEPNYIGGGAGSLSFRQSPCVLCNQGMLQDAAVLALADCPSSVGVAHGWAPISEAFKVTRAEANAVLELNWRPAFEIYRQVVEEHSDRSFDTEPFFDLAKSYPLGIATLDAEMIVRDPIIVRDQSLVCVGEVPEGSHVHIMHGDLQSLVHGASMARDRALAGSPDMAGGALAFFVDCISRVLFLENDFGQELERVQCGLPLIGALTLGEIANNGDAYLQFYNKTSVVGIIHESAF